MSQLHHCCFDNVRSQRNIRPESLGSGEHMRSLIAPTIMFSFESGALLKVRLQQDVLALITLVFGINLPAFILSIGD